MGRYRFEIEQFLEHFREQAAEIGKVHNGLHRKVLYAAAFDPLARAAYGKVGTQQKRLATLIRDLSGWTEAENVSLPQLCFRLRADKRYRHRLYREASKRLSKLTRGKPTELHTSPNLSELLPFATPIEHDHLRCSQYFQLFCTYRNNLVHEFREPGYGTDWSGQSRNAFYGSSIYGPWELVFPVRFVAQLYDQTLQGVRAHLLIHKINPFNQFEFGSMWRAK